MDTVFPDRRHRFVAGAVHGQRRDAKCGRQNSATDEDPTQCQSPSWTSSTAYRDDADLRLKSKELGWSICTSTVCSTDSYPS